MMRKTNVPRQGARLTIMVQLEKRKPAVVDPGRLLKNEIGLSSLALGRLLFQNLSLLILLEWRIGVVPQAVLASIALLHISATRGLVSLAYLL